MTPVDPVFAWIARGALVLLFAAAALHKLRDPGAFTSSLRDYRILPDFLASTAAWVVGANEIAVVVLLILSPDLFGPLLALGLLAAYSLAIGVNLMRGRRHIDCGCLGPAARQTISGWLLVRNALVGLAPLILLASGSARPVQWIDGLTIACSLAMLSLLWNAFHQLGSAPSASATPWSSS